MKRLLATLATLMLLFAACGDDGGAADTTTTTTAAENVDTPPADDPPADDPPADDPPADDPPADDPPADDPPADDPPDPEPAIDTSGDAVVINWDAVAGTYIPGAGPADDPFFHIHSNTNPDGFFLGIELYTVYGPGWTGETGTFDVDCGGTGICVHLSIGDGPDLGADFLASGQVTINQLDDTGYNVDVSGLRFSDGTVVADLTLVG